MKSHQETFNDVVRGLAKQNFRRATRERWNHSVTCAYRNEKGDKCAVGVLLPEDTPEAAWSFDGDVRALSKAFPWLPIWGEYDTGVLVFLQIVHDKSVTPGGMRAGLRAYAVKHGLELPKELGGAE